MMSCSAGRGMMVWVMDWADAAVRSAVGSGVVRSRMALCFFGQGAGGNGHSFTGRTAPLVQSGASCSLLGGVLTLHLSWTLAGSGCACPG